jgi:hypothetical protein
VSFFYEYTLSQYRYKSGATAGEGTYSGDPSDLQLIGSGLQGSVQKYRVGRSTPANLPSDAGAPDYNIVMPFSSVPVLGQIRERDILVDQLGRRFQVFASEWTQLGYSAQCLLLEN